MRLSQRGVESEIAFGFVPLLPPAFYPTWLKSSEISPIELFELAVRFSATRWLEPGGENWNIKAVSRDVAVYLQMKNGAVIEEEPDLSQEQIIAGAE
ncbi:unnamed protein product [Zymoseptoria tritici ST99CH_3D7]|uniref:Uncharacterized protein n=1 Tax=Zymoseptoria tritici (strain ST99CH_3D7) TaxID=1276538 RepID=A0A1X7RQV4_ZYMT9|nr:unnamed protein product [Zymoseptoria tritici ST99CH_3D7]